MKLHPVLLNYDVSVDRTCPYCRGHGVYKGEICFCVTMYYGQPISRRTAEMIKQDLIKFRREGKYASLRNS